jgi:Zn finger protein HypA/HybF involved in hydrogenase expression
MTQNNQTSAATKKISTYITMIVAIVIALAVISLLLAAYLAYTGSTAAGSTKAGDYSAAGVLAVIGLIALTMSSFTLFQSRRQAAEMKIEIPKVMTTIECRKCGTKTAREFQRGDFVFKELDACQKCAGEKQMITAIYKEVKEKEKTYAV